MRQQVSCHEYEKQRYVSKLQVLSVTCRMISKTKTVGHSNKLNVEKLITCLNATKTVILKYDIKY